MQRRVVTALFGASMGWLIVGCGGGAITAVKNDRVAAIDPDRIGGPYVPAGTRLSVRMESNLDTQQTRPGQRFVARVTSAVHGADGRVLVPAGARVEGVLVSTGSADRPRLRLDFQRIETAQGFAPLRVKVEEARYGSYPGETRYRLAPTDRFYYGAYPYGAGFTGMGIAPYRGGWGGGPGWGGYDYVPFNPRELRLYPGATMQLELDAPLIPPGTPVR